MSAFYSSYSKVDSDEAFLAGNVSAVCDYTLVEILPRYWAVETDVFKSNKANICENIKTRLKQYLPEDFDDTVLKKIDGMGFELQEINGAFSEYFKNLVDSYKTKHNLCEKQKIDDFFSTVKFQLGEYIKIYKMINPVKGVVSVLSEFYTYIIFEVFFVEYKNYMVMIVFGSDE